MKRQRRDREKNQVNRWARRSELGSHSHQVSEGVDRHLLHDLASMRFNRKRLTSTRAARLKRERLGRVGNAA